MRLSPTALLSKAEILACSVSYAMACSAVLDTDLIP